MNSENKLLRFIEIIRQQKNLSIENLCSDIISPKSYSRYLKEGMELSSNTYTKLLEKLGLNFFQVIQKSFYMQKEARQYYNFIRRVNNFQLEDTNTLYQLAKSYTFNNYLEQMFINSYLEKYEYLKQEINKSTYQNKLLDNLNKMLDFINKNQPINLKKESLKDFFFLSVLTLYFQITPKTNVICELEAFSHKDVYNSFLVSDFLSRDFLYTVALEDFIVATIRRNGLIFNEIEELIELYLKVSYEYDSKNILMFRNLFRAYICHEKNRLEERDEYLVSFYNAMIQTTSGDAYEVLHMVLTDIFGYEIEKEIVNKTNELTSNIFAIEDSGEEKMNDEIKDIVEHFCVDGTYKSHIVIKSGHINATYLVETEREDKNRLYIIQKINHYVFKDPVRLMDNIFNVTEYIRAKIKETKATAKRDVLHYYKSCDDKYYYCNKRGEYYRCYRYIDDSITFNETTNLMVIYEAGKAFGEFQNYLDDYDVNSLYTVIPDFHNTKKRYDNFIASVVANKSKRLDTCEEVVEEYLKLKDNACHLQDELDKGNLPLRVTHNDTKCNNVVFDKDTFEHLAVIDLDTVMAGLVGHDYGDAIRFTCNNAKEDETNLDKVYLDFNKFSSFTKGFLEVLKNKLTENEIATLSDSAIAMTLECGTRFLADYLDGDVYFHTDYDAQNLDRAKCQLALAKDMIKNQNKMKRIIAKIMK